MLASIRRLLDRVRRRAHGEPIPLADVAPLDRPARRTRLVRLGIAAALVGTTIAAFLLAPDAPGRRFLPARTVGVVVLDVSSSVRPQTYYRIEHVLATLAATHERFGLVLFSDVAYEALPPGTPAAELRPLLRFFAPQTQRATRAEREQPRTPWDQWFSAGTNISSGLYLASQMLQADHVERGAVVLISDLDDDPTDLGPLTNAVLELQQNHVPLEIVGLDPTPANAEFFKNLLGTEAVFKEASLPTSSEARGKLAVVGSLSTWLAVVSGIVIVLLAVDEWWAEPLRWRRSAA